MEDIHTTIENSLAFFKKQALDPQIAYPISALPYPLEVMRKALQFHVASLNKPDATREEIQQMRTARSFYITLGDYIDEQDAELVNRINRKYVALATESDTHEVAVQEKNLRSDQNHGKYLEILERIKGNRAMLREEIDPLLSVEMMG